VLAMIEINLLPSEYRPRDSTNLPLIGTLAVGIFAVGAIIIYGMQLNGELNRAKQRNETLTADRNAVKKRADEVDRKQREIDAAKIRQQTIIEISQSKVMWSLKIVQFAQIMEQFDDFWISDLSVSGKGNSGELQMNVYAMGSDLKRVAAWRERVKTDPNFFYHFGDLESDTVRISSLTGYENAANQMTFRVSLPLKEDAADEGKGRRRRRR